MIRAGREVVDSYGIVVLRGRPYDRVAHQKPWEQPKHPHLVNEATARRGYRGRKRLWDREQVVARIAGRPVPEIPVTDDEYDLLDVAEVAAMRSMPGVGVQRSGPRREAARPGRAAVQGAALVSGHRGEDAARGRSVPIA